MEDRGLEKHTRNRHYWQLKEEHETKYDINPDLLQE